MTVRRATPGGSTIEPLMARYKIGRCANGAERGSGYVRHAVNGWTAVCGAKPGRSSAGWSHEGETLDKVSCQICRKRLELQ